MQLLCQQIGVPLFVLAAGLAAQRTWVVDASGSGDFVDLPPALAAAQDGDTILLQREPGLGHGYGGGSTGKALRIFGVGSTSRLAADQNLVVEGLPAGKKFVLKGLGAKSAGGINGLGPRRLHLRNNAGAVHIENVDISGGLPSGAGSPLQIEDCHLVTLANVEISGSQWGLYCARSRVAAVGCYFAGAPGSAGVYLLDSNVDLATTDVNGGFGADQLAPGPAIVLERGSLRLTGTTRDPDLRRTDPIRIWAGGIVAGEPPPQSAIINLGGDLVIDPVVSLQAHNAPLVSGPVRFEPLAAMTARGAPIGANASMQIRALPSSPVLFVVSLTADPVATPFGDLWLNLLAHVAVQATTTAPAGHQAEGHIRYSWPVTGAIYPRPDGVLTVQGIVLENGALRLTSPAVVILADGEVRR